MPSDVLGGYLLAALFVSLALSALRAAEARRPSGAAQRAPDTRIGIPRARPVRWRSEDLLAPATIVLAGALAFAVAALVRAGQVASFAGAHHLAVLAAAVLAALVVADLLLAHPRAARVGARAGHGPPRGRRARRDPAC